jgi:hypothetical protein
MQAQLTHEESLEIISKMIRTAKGNAREGSFFFLLWGWTIAACNFAHFYLLKFSSYEHPYIVWLLSIPVAIISAVYGARLKKKASFSTHYDRLYGLIWLAMGVSIVIIIAFGAKVNYYINPLVLLLAGSGTFISGSLLRFKPLIWGGVALWLSASLAFMLPEAYHYLLGGLGVILGYLVPGYLLKYRGDA